MKHLPSSLLPVRFRGKEKCRCVRAALEKTSGKKRGFNFWSSTNKKISKPSTTCNGTSQFGFTYRSHRLPFSNDFFSVVFNRPRWCCSVIG
ncbi:hypothetical protein L484_016853 [Morus notabilis]|uniref:Uncharacterized protein n=1 Tax=Morus notabilis TaxID=981085 RepID=W9QLR8_9ROSA|nr:hypothetical protein L484_016853 [Morus notabilis]